METIDRNIIDVAKQLPLPPTMKQTDTQTTIVNEPAISREDVTQLESVITKTIENTNEQEVEQEIKKSINERKAATEKVMSNDPNVATVDDFLPIVEIFSDDDAIEIKPKGSLELPSPENDYVIEDSHSVAVAGSNDGIGDIDAPKEEKILPKTPTAIENEKIEVTTVRRFTEKLSDEIAPNKIDDVTINSKTEKVSQIAGQPIQPPFTAESEFTQKFFHVCHHVSMFEKEKPRMRNFLFGPSSTVQLFARQSAIRRALHFLFAPIFLLVRHIEFNSYTHIALKHTESTCWNLWFDIFILRSSQG